MLNIVLRTCSKSSLQDNRIYDKKSTIKACFNSLINSISNIQIDYKLYVIDDNSDDDIRSFLLSYKNNNIDYCFINDKPEKYLQNPKLKSRYSVKIAYDYIRTLNPDDLVLILEDDYLFYPNSLNKLIEDYDHFTKMLPDQNIGIFPQDFNQLYYDPINNPFNETYVNPCYIFPGTDRYYRTTTYTHESFMVSVKLIHDNYDDFLTILTIGENDYNWEMNTFCSVWRKDDVKMLMPINTLCVHLGALRDISYFINDWQELFNQNLPN
jgi:hypothetical protein